MSKLTESYRALGIHNSYGYAGHGNPFISFEAATRGRGLSRSAQFSVVRPGFRTDTNAHFLDNGCKTFSMFGKTKEEAFAEAQEWAGKRYSITEWSKTPYGSWMSATFVTARNAELKEKLKALDKPPEKVVE